MLAGVTNEYLINVSADHALTYNDNSVNENWHVASAFRILRAPGNNFLEHLPEEEYRFVRRMIILIVLGTDMASHKELLTVSLYRTSLNSLCLLPLGDRGFDIRLADFGDRAGYRQKPLILVVSGWIPIKFTNFVETAQTVYVSVYLPSFGTQEHNDGNFREVHHLNGRSEEDFRGNL